MEAAVWRHALWLDKLEILQTETLPISCLNSFQRRYFLFGMYVFIVYEPNVKTILGNIARDRGSAVLPQRGPYCHNLGSMFPSSARASSVGKLLIMWFLIAKSTACFSFCIKIFHIFRKKKLAQRLVVFLIHLRDPGKISVLLAFSGSFAMKNDNIHIFLCFGCKLWIGRLCFKQKCRARNVSIETFHIVKYQARKSQSQRTDYLRLLCYEINHKYS